MLTRAALPPRLAAPVTLRSRASRGRPVVVVAGMFGGRSSSSKTTAKEAAAPTPMPAADAADFAEVGAPSQQQLPPAPVYLNGQARTAVPVYSDLPPAPIYGSNSQDAAAYNSYVGVPPLLPPLPPPSMSAGSARSSGPPAWLWVGLGIILATVYQKVTGFLKGGGAQQAAANLMMQQMMKQAAKQGGGGAAGGFPGFPPPGAGMPPGFGFPPPPTAGGSPFGAAFDTMATTSSPPSPFWAAGSKFEAVKAREEAAKAAAAWTSSSPSTTASTSPSASSTETPKKSFSAFKDVIDEPSPLSSSSSGTAAGGNGAAASTSGGGWDSDNGSETGGKKKFSSELVDGFFRDPAIQQMFYQHLPEEMRNPETFEWILSNPENRAQLEALVEAQAGNLDPAALSAGMGNTGDMTKKLAELGVTPADMMAKIMKEPELASAMQKPKVMQAIMEMQSDPMAFLKYTSDADVMLVLNKLQEMFGPATATQMQAQQAAASSSPPPGGSS